MAEKVIHIGGASGAWGDSPMAIPQLLTADVHYLMMDYLAEVTMSLLARARMKDVNAGFPPDFVAYLKRSLPEIARRGIKVVSNGGGVNPQAAKRALEAVCAEQGLSLKIAVVEGDDVLPRIDTLRAATREASTGEPLPAKLLTANAYLGALPIAAALDRGADIVITGRCADSALALGILVHEFQWKADQYDRLAAGSLVGHILECGPQSTGGVHTDWDKVPGWENIGYPIASCKIDGSFVLSKPDHTGGLIVRESVAEQVLYEVGDPAAYILPDVVADFTQVALEQVGDNRVRVSGAKGYPPTSQYKVSATWQDGWRGVAVVSIVGPDAVAKAERTADALLARARMLFRQRQLPDFTATHTEALGAESAYGPKANARGVREVLMRLVVDHVDREAIDVFARELGSVGISFAQGTTGIFSGRPKPTPVVRLFTFFIDKAVLGAPKVQIGNDDPFIVGVPTQGGYVAKPETPEMPQAGSGDANVEIDLRRLAVARSGDKGNGSNIAIIARKAAYVPHLRREVTPEKIAAHFEGLVHGKVTRFEASGLHAFNFLLEDALGGGGMASRRIDPQGKAFGQMALEMKIKVPAALAQELEKDMTRAVCFLLSLLAFAQPALAQSWPSRQITIVVPFPAGALSDAAARILQPRLSEALGQSVVIENKGGAGGVIGSTFVARSQPDGYTLLVTVNAPVVMAPALQKSYPFDPLKALAGVSLLTETYLALAVRSDSPIRSVADVIRLAKERPLTFGSAGVGSAHQIAGALLSAKAGISLSHVPFQGGGPAVQALVGGHIDMSFATLPSLMALVKDGQLRLVALAETKRYAAMPDLPTINETVAGVETTAWVGMFAPAGTPKDILEKLAAILREALQMPDIRDKMLALGMVPVPKGPDEFDRMIADELKFWQAAVEIAKIEKQ